MSLPENYAERVYAGVLGKIIGVYLDYLAWDGAPSVALGRPRQGGMMWRRAWVDGIDQYESRWAEPYRLIQNEGVGLLIQGAREWTDYRVGATLTPRLAVAAGIGARAGDAPLLCPPARRRRHGAPDEGIGWRHRAGGDTAGVGFGSPL